MSEYFSTWLLIWSSGFLGGAGVILLIVRLLPTKLKIDLFVRTTHNENVEVQFRNIDGDEGEAWRKAE